MDFIDEIKKRAREKVKKIVLPESNDLRILNAAARLSQEGIAEVVLIGNEEQIASRAQNEGIRLEQVEIIDPVSFAETASFAHTLFQLRKDKGMSEEEARELMENPLYFSTMLVYKGYAGGAVAGADNSTGDVLRPALQIIKTAPGISTVSGAFIMLLHSEYAPEGRLVMADCAVNPEPDSDQLAQIGVASSATAKNIAAINPRTSFLSFSTKGSAEHPLVEKVKEAVKKAQKLDPGGYYDGELQADASLVARVAEKKAPESPVAGRANVLIFPDLQAGNIGYKLVERLAGGIAVGPILQGMARPINDLSRGCSVEDVINLVAITSLQAGENDS